MRRQQRRERFIFFNDTATTEIYTLSLHDALPIYPVAANSRVRLASGRERPRGNSRARSSRTARATLRPQPAPHSTAPHLGRTADRKSTRLNSSHANISYAVFCLKKKKTDSYCFVH